MVSHRLSQPGQVGTLIPSNEKCESHIGCVIGEDRIGKPILDKIFEIVEKKKYNNQGYEFLCKNPRQVSILKLEFWREF